MSKKLSAYQIYIKVHKENLTKEQCKQLLIDNGIIVPKSKSTGKEADKNEL